jgi:hypothetical protein
VHKKLLAAARSMADESYVYFAEAGRKEMEDDGLGVRHLPFSPEGLPHFGNLSAIVVQGDKEQMMRAHAAHPEAHIYLFDPSPQLETFTDLIDFSARLRAA